MQLVYTLLCFIIISAIQISFSGRVINPYSDGHQSEGPKTCTKVIDCGNSGCCLKGTCSLTGATFDKCYMTVKENGMLRPSGVWNKTDVCPCDYGYYCWTANTNDTDPMYGRKGFCNPIMG